MYNNITDCIESLNVVYNYQHAIITLVNKITSSLDTSDLVIGVFLDLKKRLWILLTTQFYLTKCMHMTSGVIMAG